MDKVLLVNGFFLLVNGENWLGFGFGYIKIIIYSYL
jgi:hypothetical protein